MITLIIQDNIAKYGPGVRLTADYADGGSFRDTNCRLDNAEVITVDQLPKHWRGGVFTWNGSTLAPMQAYLDEILPELKAEKHQERIKALETAREAGFAHNGSLVASDAISQTLLTSLNTEASLALLSGDQAQLDQFANGLGDGWRAVDGTIVATTAAEFRSMMQSWYAHVAATDAISQQHKAAINAAATFGELDAIDVTAGYDDAD
jgi:hypothetical protein